MLTSSRGFLRVNILGQFICARPFSRTCGRGLGRIIDNCSAGALQGTPMMLHYTTSKGAMVALTRDLAREVGNDGMAANAIAPGSDPGGVRAKQSNVPIRHPLQNRAIDTDEVTKDLIGPLLFRRWEASAFITGQTIAVDGRSVML